MFQIFVYLIKMPPRKAAAKPPIAKKIGKSGSGEYSDEHQELQTNYWTFQVMTYDSAQPWQINEMKAKKEDLDAAVQGEKMGSLFNNCIQHFFAFV